MGINMKEVTKLGLKQFLRLILINVMCFFVVISFSVLSTAAFTKNIGYTAYGTSSESSEPEELYTYYYADGEDTKKQEYTDRGYTCLLYTSGNSSRCGLQNTVDKQEDT